MQIQSAALVSLSIRSAHAHLRCVMEKRMKQYDKNGDGRVTSEEFTRPERVLGRLDAGGVIAKMELTAISGNSAKRRCRIFENGIVTNDL